MAPGEVAAEGPPGIVTLDAIAPTDRDGVPDGVGATPRFRGGRATLAGAFLRLRRRALPPDAQGEAFLRGGIEVDSDVEARARPAASGPAPQLLRPWWDAP
jgi:hypothetical protein